MPEFETILRTSFEPLQYAVFFGLLIALGLAEAWLPRGRASSRAPGHRLGRWPANFTLTALNIVVLGAIPITGLMVADLARDAGAGLLNIAGAAPAAAFVLTILLRSLLSWGVHLAMHKLPLLWRVHRVHHSDEGMDVSTTVRFHPLEFLIATPVMLAAAWGLGLSPAGLMAYELFDAAMAVISHANLRLPRPLDRVLRLVIVTPDMHRVHHSAWQPETDSNYGATFSFWDRIFGTYRDPDAARMDEMQIGLQDIRGPRTRSLPALLAAPFRRGRLAKRSSTQEAR